MENARKTMKREYAITLMVALFAMFVWGLIENREEIVEVAKYLTYPVFLFNAAAFGLDAVAKQLTVR